MEILPIPLFGVFKDRELKIVAAGGGLQVNDWKQIIDNDQEGVLLYIADE